MKYKSNIHASYKIKNFLKKNKLFYFVFYNSKKQKSSIKIKQNLSKIDFTLTKFNNLYIKKLFILSIFSNISFLFDSFIYFGNAENKNFSFHNIKNFNVFSILFDNCIYIQSQLKNITSLNFLSNINKLYTYILKSTFSNLYHLISFKKSK